MIPTLCVQCGPGVCIDEDGCCLTCGSTAVGPWAAKLIRVPRVGVGVLVLRDGRKVLMGLRKGAHGAGTWSFPGGHLEYGETPEHAAYRELHEETGMLSIGLHDLHWATNDFMEDEKQHYVTLFVRAEVDPGDEPILREPERCNEWRWFDWDEMPDNLFLPIRNLFESGFRDEVTVSTSDEIVASEPQMTRPSGDWWARKKESDG